MIAFIVGLSRHQRHGNTVGPFATIEKRIRLVMETHAPWTSPLLFHEQGTPTKDDPSFFSFKLPQSTLNVECETGVLHGFGPLAVQVTEPKGF